MGTYRYLVCDTHKEGMGAVKNLALPMHDAFVYSTFLAKHNECTFSVVYEDAYLDGDYTEFNEVSAYEYMGEVIPAGVAKGEK